MPKQVKWVFTVLIVLCVSYLVYYVATTVLASKPADTHGEYEEVAGAPLIPPLDVEAKQLSAEMTADSARTLAMYGNKVLRVNGVVAEVDEDYLGNPVVYLQGVSEWERVGLKGIRKDVAKALAKGTGLGVNCFDITELGGSVFLDCK